MATEYVKLSFSPRSTKGEKKLNLTADTLMPCQVTVFGGDEDQVWNGLRDE